MHRVGVRIPRWTARVERAIATVRPGLEVGDMVWPGWHATNPF